MVLQITPEVARNGKSVACLGTGIREGPGRASICRSVVHPTPAGDSAEDAAANRGRRVRGRRRRPGWLVGCRRNRATRMSGWLPWPVLVSPVPEIRLEVPAGRDHTTPPYLQSSNKPQAGLDTYIHTYHTSLSLSRTPSNELTFISQHPERQLRRLQPLLLPLKEALLASVALSTKLLRCTLIPKKKKKN